MYVVSLEWMDIIATLEILEPSQPRAEIALKKDSTDQTGKCPLKKFSVGRSCLDSILNFYCFKLDPGITMYNLKILMTRKKNMIKKRGAIPNAIFTKKIRPYILNVDLLGAQMVVNKTPKN